MSWSSGILSEVHWQIRRRTAYACRMTRPCAKNYWLFRYDIR